MSMSSEDVIEAGYEVPECTDCVEECMESASGHLDLDPDLAPAGLSKLVARAALTAALRFTPSELSAQKLPRHSDGRAKLKLIKTRRLKAPTEPTLSEKLLAIREIGYRVPTRAELTKRDLALGGFFQTAKGFLHKCASWFIGDDMPREDVLQEARLAMWGAMLDWDPERAPFDTHARWRIRTALGSMLRASRLVRGKKPDYFVGTEDAAEIQAESNDALEQMIEEERELKPKFMPRGRKCV